jgi:hypothetical protein
MLNTPPGQTILVSFTRVQKTAFARFTQRGRRINLTTFQTSIYRDIQIPDFLNVHHISSNDHFPASRIHPRINRNLPICIRCP